MISVDIIVSDPRWRTAIAAPERCFSEVLANALDDCDGGPGALPAGQVEVTILLASDEDVRRLNRDYRHQDRPTNVLAFPNSFMAQNGRASNASPTPYLLGDIVLAYETVRTEAKRQKKSLTDHATHLVVHGFLHLCGFNHKDSPAAQRMEAKETAILARVGIAPPYESHGAKTGMRDT